MNNKLVKQELSIQSYVEKNRNKLDESLVSLRLMKEIDLFLDVNNISNKSLAYDLGYSESFVSQLMSGVKKINTSFINKFEKEYNVKIKFSIQEEENSFISIYSMSFWDVNINLKDKTTIKISLTDNNLGEYIDYEEVETSFFDNNKFSYAK